MPWFCNGCGERRGGTTCKKRCCGRYGDIGAERVPRLDGVVFFNDDGTGVPRWELRRYEESPLKRGAPESRSVQGPRPSGWDTALEVIGARAALLIVVELPEG